MRAQHALVFALLPALAWAQGSAALPSLAPMIDSVKQSVVNVDVTSRSSHEDAQSELMERFFGLRPHEQEIRKGAGSGFIVDPKGLVLTNNHVVQGALTIRVRLPDGRAFDAQVLGQDPLTDLAVLKLKGKIEALPVAKLGDSSAMHVGDWVVAIGNPYGLASTVSAGIVSALDRSIGAGLNDQFLQTDAAINPGNSGGPLFNLKGEVVGINSMIAGIGTGIGFAVPSNLAKTLMPQLEKGEIVRGWLGVGIQDLTPELSRALKVPSPDGALITSVNEGSPAAKGGVKEDDVVVSVDGDKVTTAASLRRAVAFKKPASAVTLSVVRNGKPEELKVNLGTRPNLEEDESPARGPKAPEAKQPKVGLSLQIVDPRLAEQANLPKQGALVIDVVPGSPADRAGLRRGMVITEVNHKPVKTPDDLMRVLTDAKPGAALLMRFAVQGGRGLVALEIPSGTG